MLYFLANDERVPLHIRDEVVEWGADMTDDPMERMKETFGKE